MPLEVEMQLATIYDLICVYIRITYIQSDLILFYNSSTSTCPNMVKFSKMLGAIQSYRPRMCETISRVIEMLTI